MLTASIYRSRGESGVYVLDPATSECLHYEPVIGHPPKSHVNIPREILAEHPEVEIRNDLIDCSIDVCSVEVRSCPRRRLSSIQFDELAVY